MSSLGYDVISAIGPASDALPHTVLDGYTPVSRNGEVTQHAFIDSNLWNTTVGDGLSAQNRAENANDREEQATAQAAANEKDPSFHEWASVQPGQICVFRKFRSLTYQRHAQAEMAVPVLACAQKYSPRQNKQFQFAGVCRSKSNRDYDDVANGIKQDEFFTLHIGGPVTILNNGNDNIKIGDPVEWTFLDNDLSFRTARRGAVQPALGKKVGPRRIQVRKAKKTHARVFGKALSFARRGEPFDVLVGFGAM